MVRVLQRVAAGGRVFKVASTIAATWAGVMRFRRPGRGGIAKQAQHARREIALRPQIDLIAAQSEPLGHMRGADAVGQHQHHAGAQGQFLRRVAIGNDLLQLGPVGRRDHKARGGHEQSPPYRMTDTTYSDFLY